MAQSEIYTGPFKVVRVFRDSGRRQVLRRGLTEREAQQVVKSHPSTERSMVVYFKQYHAARWYKPGPTEQQRERAEELIAEGRAMLDSIAEEITNSPRWSNDKAARRQALNDAADGFERETVERARLREEITAEQFTRVSDALSDYAGRLHDE